MVARTLASPNNDRRVIACFRVDYKNSTAWHCITPLLNLAHGQAVAVQAVAVQQKIIYFRSGYHKNLIGFRSRL